jgi:hypothetical protein
LQAAGDQEDLVDLGDEAEWEPEDWQASQDQDMHEELHVELPRCTLEDFDPSAVQHESMWTQRKANQRGIRAIRDVTRNMLRHATITVCQTMKAGSP